MPVQFPSDKRRQSVNVSTNKTLTAADQGIVQNVIADGIIITLPSTAAGTTFVIRNGGVPVSNGPVGSGSNASAAVLVSPAAADAIAGNGFTAAVNKDAINTKTTSSVGDEITLVGSGTAGAAAWNIQEVVGTWAREA
jgi:hypothetical protein